MDKNRSFYTNLIKTIGDHELIGITDVQLLKFAKNENYFNESELTRMVNENGEFIIPQTEPLREKYLRFYGLCCQISDRHTYDGSVKYVLKPEFFIYLRELEELEFATKNAKEAKRFSIFAVIFSLISIGIAFYQVLNPIEIKTEQINEIKHEISSSKINANKLQTELINIENKIDTLIKLNKPKKPNTVIKK
jgi:hypothetical protein